MYVCGFSHASGEAHYRPQQVANGQAAQELKGGMLASLHSRNSNKKKQITKEG